MLLIATYVIAMDVVHRPWPLPEAKGKKGDKNNSESFMCGWNKTKVVGHAPATVCTNYTNFFSLIIIIPLNRIRSPAVSK